MELTSKDLAILKILVEKELTTLEKEGEQLLISNSPFLNKADDSDIEFLKAEVTYKKYLEELKEKL